MSIQIQTPGQAKPSTVLVILAWFIAVATFAYMLPWAIAVSRAKSNAGAIGLLNLFLGWSVLGWIISIVMACGTDQAATNIVVVNQPHVYQGLMQPPAGQPYPAGQGQYAPQALPGQYAMPVQQGSTTPVPAVMPPAQDPYAAPAVMPPTHDPYAPPAVMPPTHDPYAPPAVMPTAHDPYAPPAPQSWSALPTVTEPSYPPALAPSANEGDRPSH